MNCLCYEAEADDPQIKNKKIRREARPGVNDYSDASDDEKV